MMVTYGLQFMDKALLGVSAVFTLLDDTHLHGQEYNWVGSIFYFGAMLFEYPLAMLLHKFPAPTYLGFFIFAWGICLVMANFCVSFTGLMIARFVLGALESVIAPCFLVITAHWYTPQEQPIRQVLYFLGTPVFGIFNSILAYALGNTHTHVASWRLLHILLGCTTALWGIFFAYAFPSSWETASFLTAEQRCAVAPNWVQVKEAFLDPKTYIFFIIGICNTVPGGSLSNFSTILIKGFGFDDLQSQILGIPSHVIQIYAILFAGILSTKVANARLISMSVCVIPSILGTVLLCRDPFQGDHKWPLAVSIWIIYTNTASIAVSFSVISGNVAGFSKKTTVSFLLFLGYCIRNIIAPQFFREDEAYERYPTAVIAMLISFCVLFVAPLILWCLYSRENKRRDHDLRDGGVAGPPDSGNKMDLTDIEDKSFRYAL